MLERFAWRLSCGGRAVALVLREGFADEEFIDLARTPERDAAQEARLTELKRALAARVLARRAGRGRRAQPALTTASIVTAPRASATETRWWPSRTAKPSPAGTTEIGGSTAPRASASQTPLPALAHDRRGPERRVELLRAVRLQRAGDLPRAGSRARRARRAGRGDAGSAIASRSAGASRSGGAGSRGARGPASASRGRTPSPPRSAATCSWCAASRDARRRPMGRPADSRGAGCPPVLGPSAEARDGRASGASRSAWSAATFARAVLRAQREAVLAGAAQAHARAPQAVAALGRAHAHAVDVERDLAQPGGAAVGDPDRQRAGSRRRAGAASASARAGAAESPSEDGVTLRTVSRRTVTFCAWSSARISTAWSP